MALNYTYDQFVNEANSKGLLGAFSQADLNLAKTHPDYGMSILTLKQQYNNAANPDERVAIHNQANALRSSYGSFSGNADGSGYVADSKLETQLDNKTDQLNNYAKFSYNPFSYNVNTDPLYQQYRKQYVREGNRATANALAQTSAASGGIASSYAVGAATGANNYYMAQLNDKVPQLAQLARDNYNTDRSFAYGVYGDDYNRLIQGINTLQGQSDRDRQEQQRQLDERQRQWTNAYNTWTTTGTVDATMAKILGVPPGTQTMALTQQQKETALQMMQLMGTATGGTASTLGVAPGTQTLEGRAAAQKTQADAVTAAMDRASKFGFIATKEDAAALGLPLGTRTSDQAYRNWEMKSAQTKADVDAAKERFNNGDMSDGVIRTLVDAGGYTQQQLVDAGYTGRYFGINSLAAQAYLQRYLTDSGQQGSREESMLQWYGYTPEMLRNMKAQTAAPKAITATAEQAALPYIQRFVAGDHSQEVLSNLNSFGFTTDMLKKYMTN